MADKDITIVVKTSGTDAAAEDIKDVSKNVENLGDQTSTASKDVEEVGTKVQDLGDTAADASDEIKDIGAEVEDLGDKVEELGEKSSEADESLKQLVNLERAKAVESIGKAFGMIGDAVGSMRRELGGANPELDRTLKQVETGLNSVEGALTGAAAGFAVGGPFGAAIGGFIGLASGPLGDAFQEMTADLKAAAEAENAAAQSALNYTRALEARRTRLQELSFERFWQAEEDGINRATNALRRQNQELAARRGADSSTRETAQAEALQGGAPRADVARADIAGDIGERLNAVDDKQNAAAEALALMEEAASDAALKASDAASLGIEGFKEKQAEAEALAKELEEAKADFESSQTIAEEERRGILADLGQRVLDETKALEQEAAAKAEEVVAEIEGSGAVLAESNRRGIAAVAEITADGRVTEAEQAKLSAALAASMAGIRTSTESLLRITEGMEQATRAHTNRIGALEVEVNNLKRRAVTPARNQ